MPRLARGLLLLLLGAGVCVAGGKAQAADRLWSGILLATQVGLPKAPPVELGREALKIEHVFGCNQLELVGSASKEIDPQEEENWLVPTQHFWMSVKVEHEFEDGYLMKITLYHDKRQLAETETKVAPAAPLIIRGPVHARGQLVVVLQLLRTN